MRIFLPSPLRNHPVPAFTWTFRTLEAVLAPSLAPFSRGQKVCFPAKFLHFADKIVMTKVQRREARCDFAGIKPGTYALAIIHDENLNGELDTNFFGVPTEGYGFSSDAKASLSAPSFSAASFSYNGQSLDLTIRLNY